MKEPENWLREFIIERLEHEGSMVAIFVGRTGSSKSGSAISLAYAMDPTFNLDRIVFSVDDFFRISTEEHLAPGSFIIFDDAGVGAGSRDWQSEKNKSLGAILQTFRYKQLPTLITTPNLYFIDKQVRNSVEILFQATDTKGLFKPFVLYESPRMDGEIWHSYPSVGGVEIKLWPFPPPPDDFFRAYKEKKDMVFQRMIKEKFNQIQQEESLRRTILETKEETIRRQAEIVRMRQEREEMRLAKEKQRFESGVDKQEETKNTDENRVKTRRDSEARKKRIIQLRGEGLTYGEIAKMEGISEVWVYKVLSKNDK